MSGPRVTSGTESKQDYRTPSDLMKKISDRFGPISFDLAAHAGNAQHARYFAPTHFIEQIILDHHPWNDEDYLAHGFQPGTDGVEVGYVKHDKKKGYIWEKKTRNDDPKAYAKDAFAHSWASLSRTFGNEHPSGQAHLWLNCEFNDVTTWSARCLSESREGARITLLTPFTTANWFRDNIAGKADAYPLSGRLSFDGKNVFPKDCMISHYSPDSRGDFFLWDWQDNRICQTWKSSPFSPL